ncbi:Piso0_005061 [Millerozyma farinosa CBS 7064]|uniref:Peroxin-3 n=1 Tax=Pichia sorbitophila (strain ATCC MYA-4447 / BCRC 22081 / CBS 7064 / NBRC 10061 / NRRL Y-12695) TaxID=559304 RepID=G8Y162_PICSO|nr:Piso0_005061 [Millerozyma farinosa CBS 7064]
MAVFSSLSSFVNRHKKKFIFTAIASVSIYYLINQYVIKRIRNFRDSLKQELFVKEQIKRRFMQTQTDCYVTVLALIPILSQPIINYLPTELITQALKLKKSNAKPNANNEISDSLLTTDNLIIHQNSNDSKDLSYYMNLSKTDLWSLLKIKTLTRTLTLMYSVSSLLLLTRLQLNTVARRSYIQSVILLAGGQVENTENSQDYYIEQAYLSLSWWLLNKGWQNISDVVESHVISKFESINARTELTLPKFDEILTEVMEQIKSSKRTLILDSVFPCTFETITESLLNTNPDLINDLDNEESLLVKLNEETIQTIHSELFSDLFFDTVMLTKTTLMQNLSQTLEPKALETDGLPVSIQSVQPPKSFKLANILAQLSVQCGILCDSSNLSEDGYDELSGNVYVNTINDSEQLEEFSASIYSNFD